MSEFPADCPNKLYIGVFQHTAVSTLQVLFPVKALRLKAGALPLSYGPIIKKINSILYYLSIKINPSSSFLILKSAHDEIGADFFQDKS